MARIFIGGLIVFVLLGLYGFAVYKAVEIVNCLSNTACDDLHENDFTPGMQTALTLIGGLVSALVVAELALTKPGERPLARTLPQNALRGSGQIVQILSIFFLIVWLCTGLAAFFFGTMLHYNTLKPLTDFGLAWLGLAVSSGYAYLGIQPRQ